MEFCCCFSELTNNYVYTDNLELRLVCEKEVKAVNLLFFLG